MELEILRENGLGVLNKIKEDHIIKDGLIGIKPRTNKLLSHIANFATNILEIDMYISPEIYAYDNMEFSLQDGPYYSPTSKRIFLPKTSKIFSYESSDFFEEVAVISHECGHHIQNILQIHKTLNLTIQEYSILRESQADYFAGFFVGYCLQQGLLNIGDVDKIRHLFKQLGLDTGEGSIESIIASIYSQGSFVSVKGDYHGTQKHREEMFNLGYEFQDIGYFNEPINFVPRNIVDINYSLEESYNGFSDAFMENLNTKDK